MADCIVISCRRQRGALIGGVKRLLFKGSLAPVTTAVLQPYGYLKVGESSFQGSYFYQSDLDIEDTILLLVHYGCKLNFLAFFFYAI